MKLQSIPFGQITARQIATPALLLTLLAGSFAFMQPAQAEGDRRGRLMEELDLTQAQSEQIEAIHTDVREQIRGILTAEQRAELGNSEQSRRAFRSLDLTDDQREEIQSIREESREDISAVLTDEQRAQIEDLRAQHQGRRGRRQN